MPKISDYDLPAVSTRTRLQIQKRLDERGKRAMTQREETPELLPTKEDVKVLNIDDDRPEVIAAKHRKAVAIQVRLQNMSKNQIVDELDWKPSVIKSEITQQMIDEHRAEQNAPVKITRPDGTEGFFKYDPTSIDLSPIIPNTEAVVTDAQIDNARLGIVKKLGEISRIKIFLSKTAPAERKAIDDRFNVARATYAAGAVDYTALRARVAGASKRDQDAIAFDLGTALKRGDSKETRSRALLASIAAAEAAGGRTVAGADPDIQYNLEKEALRQSIEQNIADQAQLLFEIDQIKAAIASEKVKTRQNSINIAEAEKQTRARNKEAVDELKVRNAGKPIPEQQPGETDEQYRQRLVDLGDEVLDDDEVQRSAESLQIIKAKYNLKEFISDASKIENIIKKLTPDELTVFNTKFPAYKKKYLETYGFNNRNMSVDDIVGFIQTDFTTPSAPPAPPAAAAASPYRGSTAFENIKVIARDGYGIDTNRRPLEFLVAAIEDAGGGIPDDVIEALRPQDRAKLLNAGLLRYYTAPAPAPVKAGPKFPARALGPTFTGVGLGVHLRKLPSVVQFGKIHIKPSNLYYENILSIRTSTGQALRAYKDEKISNHLASLIIKLLEGGTVSKNDLRSLSEKEVMIYDNLIRRSQLHKELDNSWDETAIKMKTRFQILEGEYHAGNDNPLIKEELHELLFKMGNAKIITPHEASRYWNEMNK